MLTLTLRISAWLWLKTSAKTGLGNSHNEDPPEHPHVIRNKKSDGGLGHLLGG